MGICVINVLSRKGGVGKTSIALSVGAQLAAANRKTALLDLDTQGTHSSACLPLSCMTSLDDDGVYVLNNEEFVVDGESFPGFHRQLPYWSWIFQQRVMRDRGTPGIEDVLWQLRMSEGVRRAAGTVDASGKLSNLAENLHISPGSFWIRDIEPVHRAMSHPDGHERYHRFLTRCVRELSRLGFEYVVLDHSPGLNFNSGVSLNWTINHCKQHPSDVIHNWFVSNSPWWELGILYYELLADLELKRVHPSLVINRAEDSWKQLPLGSSQPLAEAHAVCDAFTANPLWQTLSLTSSQLLKDHFKLDIRVSALRRDDGVRKSMVYGPPGSEWPVWTEGFMTQFFIPCLIGKGGFHADVRAALTSRFLDDSPGDGP